MLETEMPRLLARRVVNIEHDSFLGDAKHLEIQTNWTRIPHIPSMINVATSPATTAPPTMNRSANALLTPCAIMTSRPPAARCARTTFACDVAYWITGNANWAIVTLWLLGAGIIMGALTALAGLTDVIGEQRIRALNDAWLHAGGMVTVVLIEIYNWYAHRGRSGYLAEGHYPFAGGCMHPVVRRLDGLEHGLSPSRWDRRRGSRCAVIRDATKGGIIILLDRLFALPERQLLLR